MISENELVLSGFKYQGCVNGYLYKSDKQAECVVGVYEGEVYIRQGGNYHGIEFKGVKDIYQLKALYKFITGKSID
jgi:hypothetical protein